ncbi:hypothetical protein Ga0074812_11916 [Parafrankia irregularis]|uniref:Uncharacterized protein n=1 Tax=Parafrankia irregularis TaxID=795642 RepID=A0A0S4QS03_9ACTN|nr:MULTISPECIES: hypothetical protein [Parafrankia]MBE3204535.1 hypothetical protein [Parafrankia sp. CH37]CUU58384.1 hypothetical protein Ga0074812_11916 [Parafrankia irregularis]
MTLTPLAAACNTAACPAVFLDESGAIVIRGDQVDPPPAAVVLSPGEAVVVIPPALLLEAARRLGPL